MVPSFPQEAGLVSPTGLANGGSILLSKGDVCAPEHKLRARTSENSVKRKFNFREFVFHALGGIAPGSGFRLGAILNALRFSQRIEVFLEKFSSLLSLLRAGRCTRKED